MRVRIPAVVAVAVVLLSLAASPVSAGGWWNSMHPETQSVAIGEKLSFAVRDVHFATMEAADAARSEQYYAYLVPEYNRRLLRRAMTVAEPKRWWERPAEAYRVGTVTLSDWNSTLVRARVRMDIPTMPVGRYSLVLCTAGCTKPLADVIPHDNMRVFATGGAAAARELQRVRREHRVEQRMLHREMAYLEDRLDGAQRDARRRLAASANSAVEADLLRADVDRLLDRNEELNARLAAADARSDQVRWAAIAGWAIAGLLAIVGTVRRRRSSGDDHPPPDVPETVPSEWEMADR